MAIHSAVLCHNLRFWRANNLQYAFCILLLSLTNSRAAMEPMLECCRQERDSVPQGSILEFLRLRGESKPDKCISRHERRDRDIILEAVAMKIHRDRIPDSEIIVGGRPIYSRYRERILRREFDAISLRRAYLIANAVGVRIELRAVA